MKKNIFILIIISVLISSCSQYRTVKYKFTNTEENKLNEIHIKVPKGYKRTLISTIEGNEVKLIYPDSSIIFISDNFLSGSISNMNNRKFNGIDVIYRKSYNDTLTLIGEKNGQFWEERILNNIVIGYANISEKRKMEFDRIFLQIKRIKK